MTSDHIGEKIVELHNELRQSWPHLSRLAIAIYDRDTDLLKTFVRSHDTREALQHYSAKLANVPSLKVLAESGKSRNMPDLEVLAESDSAHSKWLLKSGFRSSYTVPLYAHEHFLGFLFFDADESHYFSSEVVSSLAVYAELIGAILVNDLAPANTLRGAINTAKHLTHHRDEETAAHIQRMSHYSQLIAKHMAPSHELSDEYVEFILQYSPLHDIGKIAIPDHILLKPGRLTDSEYEVVKLHVEKGVEILDAIIKEFDFGDMDHLDILRNIIATHHERYDGSGYPQGLVGTDIPLEGRITAVADVLDALTTVRPYKQGWAYDEAVWYIVQQSGLQFDPDCVQVLADHPTEFMEIYQRYQERDA